MSRDKMTTTSVHLNDHSQCMCVCNSVSVLKSCNRCSSNSSSGEHPGRATETGPAVHVAQKIA